ncbi:hypothetical protein DVT68_00430 [Dyella solisilvae]|uniref:Uncharacterized protein n=1 Tax=Dyella solisilvae TaxID=1920168 RepID=A0A370K9S0_9GAMM|nr:hypothetical protein [Dyella solisilvae]RDI99365.1 hypothetical protein DVT68_00430 [Dyella solisilvae]
MSFLIHLGSLVSFIVVLAFWTLVVYATVQRVVNLLIDRKRHADAVRDLWSERRSPVANTGDC